MNPKIHIELLTKYGTFIVPRHDHYITGSLLQYGEYSEGEITLLSRILKSDNIIIEGGSNIGCHSVPLAKLVPQGHIYCFEPQTPIFELLEENLRNCAPPANWTAQKVALYHISTSSLRLPKTDLTQCQNYGARNVNPFNDGEKCDAITIDSLALNRCDLIKLDVEGAEWNALLGAKETIARFKPTLYVEDGIETKHKTLINLLFEFGYKVYWHKVPYAAHNNWLDNQGDVFPGIVSVNLLCVPNDKKSLLGEELRITSSDIEWTAWHPLPGWTG